MMLVWHFRHKSVWAKYFIRIPPLFYFILFYFISFYFFISLFFWMKFFWMK